MRVLEGIKELEGVPAVDNVDIPRPIAHNTSILQARLFPDGLLPESARRNPHLNFFIMVFFLPQTSGTEGGNPSAPSVVAPAGCCKRLAAARHEGDAPGNGRTTKV
jgi:hypothetical protein